MAPTFRAKVLNRTLLFEIQRRCNRAWNVCYLWDLCVWPLVHIKYTSVAACNYKRMTICNQIQTAAQTHESPQSDPNDEPCLSVAELEASDLEALKTRVWPWSHHRYVMTAQVGGPSLEEPTGPPAAPEESAGGEWLSAEGEECDRRLSEALDPHLASVFYLNFIFAPLNLTWSHTGSLPHQNHY